MFRKGLWGKVLLCLILSSTVYAEDVWLLVDTQKLQLEVKRGSKTVMLFENIAIGRKGSGIKTHVGDDVTPLGEYHIAWINENSPYYRFFGFDYPNKSNAKEGLAWGLIDPRAYRRIIEAHDAGEIPPQNTTLGGQIGIHGLGKANERIHRLMNWTQGCIALTNQQIDKLIPWIKKGTKVKVQ